MAWDASTSPVFSEVSGCCALQAQFLPHSYHPLTYVSAKGSPPLERRYAMPLLPQRKTVEARHADCKNHSPVDCSLALLL